MGHRRWPIGKINTGQSWRAMGIIADVQFFHFWAWRKVKFNIFFENKVSTFKLENKVVTFSNDTNSLYLT